MGSHSHNPQNTKIEQTIIDPLLDFRHKVAPLNQTHNDSIQAFNTAIMGLLFGTDGGVAMQGPGSDALAALVGQFISAENALAGSDPLTLDGRLLDAARICEKHAHNLQTTVNRQASASGLFLAGLLDEVGGDPQEDGGPPELVVSIEYGEFQQDMQEPSNESLQPQPDINAMPNGQPADPNLGENAGFLQTLGLDRNGIEGLPPGSWAEIVPDDYPNQIDPSSSTPRVFETNNGFVASLYSDGELQIGWIDNFKQLLDLPSLVDQLGDNVQSIQAYATDGLAEKYFATDELTQQTMTRLNKLAASMGFKGVVEKVGGKILLIFTRI